MKVVPIPPRPRHELSELPLHVLIRDYPELLAILGGLGASGPEHGAVRLARFTGGDMEVMDRIAQEITWRG